MWLRAVAVLNVLLCSFCVHLPTPWSYIEPENVFSSGLLEYRRLLLDTESASLYVGAKGHVFKLWAYNINDTTTDNLYAHRELSLSKADADECAQAGQEECVNAVRLLFLKQGGQSVLLCSSNGMKPQLMELEASSLQLRSPAQNVIGICSPDPHINSTATLVEWGNPEDIPSIYSGIRTGLSLDNHLIYRPPLLVNNKEVHSSMRTVYTDSKWLNEPQFVASLSIGQYVYFFLREVAVEHENCGRVVYSRVARICKSDVGGKNVLRQVWTSFVKARLNCSSGVQFDHIQAVHRVESRHDSFFYATFTTANVAFGGSAVCVFSLNAINQLFDQGLFAEQVATGSSWSSTPPHQVPSHRPGTCVSNSAAIPDGDLQFAKTHLLMADAIAAKSCLVTVPQQELSWITVDVLPTANVVLVYSHNSRRVLKLAQWQGAQGWQARPLAWFYLNTGPVLAMSLLPSEFLYLADARAVSQFGLAQCSMYSSCQHCAIDPYCSWNVARAQCFNRNTQHSSALGWVASSPAEAPDCIEALPHSSLSALAGDAILLICTSHNVHWTFNGQPLVTTHNKLITIEGSLVLLNVSIEQTGLYECWFDRLLMQVHRLEVDPVTCSQPTSLAQFQAVYKQWCRKMASYKESVSKWHDANAHCAQPRLSERFNHITLH